MATTSNKTSTQSPAKKTAAKKTAAKKASAEKASVPATAQHEHPLISLRHEMDRLFERFAEGWPGMTPWFRGLEDIEPFKDWSKTWALTPMPDIDIHETNKAFEITAELPGMDEKDIEVELQDDLLTIKGEKKEERDEKREGDYRVKERRYGSFRRSFTIPRDANASKVKAKFRKGVLTISLPKTRKSPPKKKVSVRSN